jgi:hypothetical protein
MYVLPLFALIFKVTYVYRVLPRPANCQPASQPACLPDLQMLPTLKRKNNGCIKAITENFCILLPFKFFFTNNIQNCKHYLLIYNYLKSDLK